jgi:sortase A
MLRKAGFALLSIGVLLVAWVGITLWRGDPFTSLYTRYEQHRLSTRLDAIDSRWARTNDARRLAATARRELATALLRRDAISFGRTLAEGRPIGRIVIPRLHLRMVVVQGTNESDLEKGPGHYDAESGEGTALPGMGRVVAIAGHRTTFLHPFRHIDDLRAGDTIELDMPYGRFRYRVYAHRVVVNTDWSILRARGFEKLVLSACHPLYSATHRWVVFARLVSAAPTA